MNAKEVDFNTGPCNPHTIINSIVNPDEKRMSTIQQFLVQFQDLERIAEGSEGMVCRARWKAIAGLPPVALKFSLDARHEIITSCDFNKLVHNSVTANATRLFNWEHCRVTTLAGGELPTLLRTWLPDPTTYPYSIYVMVMELLEGTFEHIFTEPMKRIPDAVMFECFYAHMCWTAMGYRLFDAHARNLGVRRLQNPLRAYHMTEEVCFLFNSPMQFARMDLGEAGSRYTGIGKDNSIHGFGEKPETWMLDPFPLAEYAETKAVQQFVQQSNSYGTSLKMFEGMLVAFHRFRVPANWGSPPFYTDRLTQHKSPITHFYFRNPMPRSLRADLPALPLPPIPDNTKRAQNVFYKRDLDAQLENRRRRKEEERVKALPRGMRILEMYAREQKKVDELVHQQKMRPQHPT